MNKDPHFRNKKGETPLFKAKTAKEVMLLVERGADINAIRQGHSFYDLGPDIGTTPLFYPANLEVQEALIATGADVNAVDETCQTPLFCVPPEPAFTENQIKAGANVHWKNGSRHTPLHFAVCGYPEIVKLLLAAGADANACCLEGQTPLFFTTLPEVAELLLVAGADPKARDTTGRTALFCRDEQFEPYLDEHIAKVLLAHGSFVNARDGQGQTPLHAAATPELAQVLLAHGADPWITDNAGNLPSIEAAVVARAAQRRAQLAGIAGVRPSRGTRRAM